MPYLLEQGYADSTWTLATGSQGDLGTRAGPAITQGALYSMCISAARELAGTNVRFNELYIAPRVEVDSSAAKTGAMPSSTFAQVWQNVLEDKSATGCRVSVHNEQDLHKLALQPLFKE